MPRLILISGLPGSGKTTVARAFTAQSGAMHLSSDLLRRELGIMSSYRQEDKEKVYIKLLERAEASLSAGQDVVVDSTFYKKSIRQPFRNLAELCHAPLIWVEVRAQESTIRERLKKPRPDSEADFGVYEKIKNETEPLIGTHLVLRSDEMPLDTMLVAIKEYISDHNSI